MHAWLKLSMHTCEAGICQPENHISFDLLLPAVGRKQVLTWIASTFVSGNLAQEHTILYHTNQYMSVSACTN